MGLAEGGGMASTVEERVQAAYDATVAGDVTDLVSLLHPDLEWRGTSRGHLWWRRTPS
jgi:ketosteroid isomerase-like protein